MNKLASNALALSLLLLGSTGCMMQEYAVDEDAEHNEDAISKQWVGLSEDSACAGLAIGFDDIPVKCVSSRGTELLNQDALREEYWEYQKSGAAIWIIDRHGAHLRGNVFANYMWDGDHRIIGQLDLLWSQLFEESPNGPDATLQMVWTAVNVAGDDAYAEREWVGRTSNAQFAEGAAILYTVKDRANEGPEPIEEESDPVVDPAPCAPSKGEQGSNFGPQC